MGYTAHYRLAIADASVPDEVFESQWGSAGRDIRESLGNGEALVIHCKGGLGRTGTIAARLLVELGAQPDEAIAKVRAARPGTIETRAQERHVRRCQAVTDCPVKQGLRAFSKTYFKKGFLEQNGLPNIGYPVPVDLFMQITEQPKLSQEHLLYWAQAYSELDPNGWRKIGMLADSLNGDETDSDWQVEGENWSLRFGHVDRSQEIVTLQRQGTLIAALHPCKDGVLVVSTHHGLDARAARMLTGLGQKPADDGKVAMRDNNWAYALEQSHGDDNVYASERGDTYLSYWRYGLGLSSDMSPILSWYRRRAKTPLKPASVAAQVVGVDLRSG